VYKPVIYTVLRNQFTGKMKKTEEKKKHASVRSATLGAATHA